MTDTEMPQLQKLMQTPEVQNAISSISPGLVQRRAFRPPRCAVFEQPFTVLEEAHGYRFEIDTEARRQVPRIIDNPVQVVIGQDALPDEALAAYQRRRTVGIVFSGGPAPGGHNVIAGLFDAVKAANPDSRIIGFLMGPDGIIESEYVEITEALVDQYRNIGGFTMIRTGRTKIDTPEKMALSRQTCQDLGLDALVVVGGDDSNTNAAFLAQEMMDDGIQVIGVPKTIDGDVQVRDADGNVLCAISFGFHSAARAFSQDISNLCNDCSSDRKYWHICKVMGRSASHLALEVALQTHANLTLIGEDLADFVDERRIQSAAPTGDTDFTAYGITLRHLSRVICNAIVRRAAVGKNCGVLVIPEGLLEFINEIQVFIIKLSTIIADYNNKHDVDFHTAFPRLEDKLEYLRRLSKDIQGDTNVGIWSARDDELFNDIPAFFQEGLLTERDSHGNFQFSLVETDKVLMGLVKDYLTILREKGFYKMGVERAYYKKIMLKGGLDPEDYAEALFVAPAADYLLVKESIISLKTLKQALVKAGLLRDDDVVPAAAVKIYNKSVPNLKTQTHFYGYDGRGSNPTRFDCNYTYNLGLTVFSLIANGVTGQMAAIRNLEKDFSEWEPIGIPIGPLMHLEERKGKLSLVLEKSLVDTKSLAFQIVKACREEWLAATPGEDHYRRPAPILFDGHSEDERPLTLELNRLSL
ncbi:MAG: 6-phosphofructokinase [Deltaproteobacteria bacterium]|jgi:pyrophosphate--fructose-6-phosphate 1-phosphotransferase|nr:6-phosphofructokinase [Deltaproteobacteria bacterium]